MIGKLRGIVDDIEDDSVVLDVGGVGYQVFCSARTLAALPAVGETAQLIIEMIVREDAMQLYGFPDKVEREWFRTLTTVQRVGNKVALVILGTYTPQQLAQAILAKDTSVFSRVKGIGSGLAERIVTELKDKVLKLPTSGFGIQDSGFRGKGAESPSAGNHSSSFTDDAISALVNLGYSRSEAYGAAVRAGQNVTGKGSLDELIRLSLKELVRG